MSNFAALVEFNEQNRGTGSTHHLVFAAAIAGGYLVVPTLDVKRIILNQHPGLLDCVVVTLSEIRSDRFRGQKPRPVFLDASLLPYLRGEK